MFKLKIDTRNAAFEEDASEEIISILQYVRERLAEGRTEGVLHDINGNRVGEWKLTNR